MKTNLIFLFLVFASVIGSAQTLTLKVEGIENAERVSLYWYLQLSGVIHEETCIWIQSAGAGFGYGRSLSGTTYRYVCHFIVSG